MERQLSPPAQQAVTQHVSTPANLLRQVARKDQAAFYQLYQRTSGHLLAVLLRILKSKPSAEQALTETYMLIWKLAESYGPELGAPLTWMTGLARYQAFSTLQQTITDRPIETDITDYHTDTEPLSYCLGRLSDKQFEFILRAYCEGYSIQALSAQTKIPAGNIKSSIREGLHALQECLVEHS